MLYQRLIVFILVGSMLLPQRAFALIEKPLPLSHLLTDSDCIAVAKIARINEAKTIAVIEVSTAIKGKLPSNRFSVDLTSDKSDATKQFLARIAVDTPLVLFLTEISRDGKEKEKTANFTCLTYTNGTWSQISGEKTPNGIRWKFVHHEIYLRRTFKGTTEELQKVVIEVLAGKAKAPALDNKEKPGLGPELTTP